jgi:Lipase (class 3)
MGDLTLFNEAMESTMASVSVFAVVALREIARKGLLSDVDAKEVLQLPMDGLRFRQLKDKHFEHWQKIKSGDIFSQIDAYKEKSGLSGLNVVLEYIGDENASKECVHYIGYEHTRKCIICVFRGSITMQDWIQDAQLILDRVPNPIKDIDGQPEAIGVHRGFAAYIHGAKNKSVMGLLTAGTRSHSQSVDPETPSRIDTILQELRTLKTRFPSYKIYIQGHSLGGALSLIAALSIAADPVLAQMPLDSAPGSVPVTCITLGNPKPGDGDFCRALECLERDKKLRCCVIHNTYDVVPMLAANVTGSDRGFWHPGWRILLYKGRFEWGRSRGDTSAYQTITHKGHNSERDEGGERDEEEEMVDVGCSCRPKKRPSIVQSLWQVPESFHPIQAAKNMSKERLNRHDHREYLARLLAQEDELQKLKMDDFYQEMWALGDLSAGRSK